MPDIIHLLPDSVANQIAAGEVVQRPASVVKELTENAIDAGGTEVTINIKDAGKTLIQVIDNGCGMSDTDARLSFERHATSKISNANDLFGIRSLGFRGEALASIAAIAYVDLKTKLADSELGTHINIVGSEVKHQDSVNCPSGSNFLVKNLFFNVPARRKFLKSNSTELRHIIDEFQRIALAYPQIKLNLIHNEITIYNLPESNLKQRIVNLIGKSSVQNLLPVNSNTSLVNIYGFAGKPENSRKTAGEQFFFVNGRYMKSPYLYKSVMKAYEKILQPGLYPSFFIYFDVNPEQIDINIHPTKTEIKFADEKAIWQILHATLRETLGKFNVVPSIEFNQANPIEITTAGKATKVPQPNIDINYSYNPFEQKQKKGGIENWQKLYPDNSQNLNSEIEIDIKNEPGQQTLNLNNNDSRFFQFKNKYIFTPVKSGLMMIHQKRAHERILFEKYIEYAGNKKNISQKTLFPKSLHFSASDYEVIKCILSDLKNMGFAIDENEKNTIKISALPADFKTESIEAVFDGFLESVKTTELDISEKYIEQLCMQMAYSSSIKIGQKLTMVEMSNLFDELFGCKTPNFSPSGKPVIAILSNIEIEKFF